MDPREQKTAAKQFAERWSKAKGSEEQEARSFWLDFCENVMGIQNPMQPGILDFEKHAKGRKIDTFFADMKILIESKSRGIDLDKAYERGKDEGGDARLVTPYGQAKWYADNLANSERPRWILTMNFDEIRIYDLENEDPEKDVIKVTLEELPDKTYLFSFFTDKSNSRLFVEKELSVKAGELVGKLYSLLSAKYANIETDAHEQHSLNVLIVRLVFLLFAEDAGVLQSENAFYNFLKDIPAGRINATLMDLFKVLNTPENERSPYLDSSLAAFPYINGGLFKDENIAIPPFDETLKVELLVSASSGFNWSKISPTIFGAVFESTLNPETRRAGGMHYTSIENIHKVIDPLFLDDLKAELAEAESEKVEKKRIQKLRMFQKKLSELTFLDPAMGSGNFLTETYVSLRLLELRIIEDIQGNQTSIFDNPIMVNINQFYGIEINDFAVSVAKTALWIAEQQMMDKTMELLPYQELEFLPLKSIDNLKCGNALTTDWNEILPAPECNFIMGNPPFVGASFCSSEQKNEVVNLYGKIKLSNSLDYVAGWYYKACQQMEQNHNIKCAFVSTNSICQGEQVAPIWLTLKERFGIFINFAWRTFVWNSEAVSKAHVHVVIIGFSKIQNTRCIFDENGHAYRAGNINPYLMDACFVAAKSRSNPISNVPKMYLGNKPTDDGNFILSEQEKDELIRREPGIQNFIKEYLGAEEYLNNKKRWCLWLKDLSESEWIKFPLTSERVMRVREFRLKSTSPTTVKMANEPNRFFFISQPETSYLMVPSTSSERRLYIPIGFLSSDVIASNAATIIPEANMYMFGILQSQFHNAWMRTVAGRLEMRYRYSGSVVYNTFIWPVPSGDQCRLVEQCAQAVLDAREQYPDRSLADLYDPDKMPSDLLAAHKALDAAVEQAYGVDFGGDEEKIVAHLFKLYAEVTEGEK